ncbi:unnamed protein product [Penicillium manginii]
MTIDLTCPEEVFQAPNQEEFVIATNLHLVGSGSPLLTDCVRSLCAENPDPAIIEKLHGESALNLFTIVTAIHGLIFHQLRAFSPFPLATTPLKKALERWELAWATRNRNISESNGERKAGQGCPAFFERAGEFALLARIHVEKSYISVTEWDDMITNLSEEPFQKTDKYLATFDQTGMDHVADLMLAVQNLDLN